MAEVDWNIARRERKKHEEEFKRIWGQIFQDLPIEDGGIAADLAELANLYRDPLLFSAAWRLAKFGLGGRDWREKARASMGLEGSEHLWVRSAEALIEDGMPPQTAYEMVAVSHAVESQSFQGAVQAVKRACLSWRDKGPDARRTAAERAAAVRNAPASSKHWKTGLGKAAPAKRRT